MMNEDSLGKIKIPTEKAGLKDNFSINSDMFRDIVKRKKKNGYQRQFSNMKKNLVRRII